MAIQDDWTIDYGTQSVTHTAGTTVYTALEFFQWLASTFAQSGQMDDDYPIASDTPTVYRWLNGWGFGAAATDIQFLRGGAFTSADGLDQWANLYSIGQQAAGTQIYVYQDGAEITPYWPTGNIDILIQIRSGGTLIDGGNVLVLAREFGDEYDHNSVDMSGGGRNVVGINTATDANNATALSTVATYSDVSITFGAISRDLNNGAGPQPYDVEIDCAGRPLSEVYEYLKYVTRHNAGGSLSGVDGERYLSASEGVYTDVKKAPFGTFAGGTFFGARGVWLTNYAAATFQLTDGNGATQAPPNYQKVIATNDNLSGCEILVAEVAGGVIDKSQYTIAGTTASTIQASSAININKVPQSGVLRVGDTRYTYTGFSGDTFSGVSPDPTGETGGFYVPLLDVLADATSEQSDNVIYASAIPVRTVVRKYGFKPFTQDTSFGANGLSFSPILTVDPQAS